MNTDLNKTLTMIGAVIVSLIPILSALIISYLLIFTINTGDDLIARLLLIVRLVTSGLFLIGGAICSFLVGLTIIHGERVPYGDDGKEIKPEEIRREIRKKWCISPLISWIIGLSICLLIITLIFFSSFFLTGIALQLIPWDFWLITLIAYVVNAIVAYTVSHLLTKYFIIEGTTEVETVHVAVIKIFGKREFEYIYLLDEGFHLLIPHIMDTISVDLNEHDISVPEEEGSKELTVLVGKNTIGMAEDAPDRKERFTGEVYIGISLYYVIIDPYAVINTAFGEKLSETGMVGGWKKSFRAVIVEGMKDTIRNGATRVARAFKNPIDYIDAIQGGEIKTREILDGNSRGLASQIVDVDKLASARKRWGIFFSSAMITNIGFADEETEKLYSGPVKELLQREGEVTEGETFRLLWPYYAKPGLSDMEILHAVQRVMGKFKQSINYSVTGNPVGDLTRAAMIHRQEDKKQEGGEE